MRIVNLLMAFCAIAKKSPLTQLSMVSKNLFFIAQPYFNFSFLMVLRYSLFLPKTIFLGLFFFENIKLCGSRIIKSRLVSYLSLTYDGVDFLMFSLKTNTICSTESIFFSLRWQEREASEFLNINFINKRDKRSLFLTPTFGLYPLEKDFPTNGFFEISLHSVFGLTYSRVFIK